jgi:hypothetical protein
MLRTLLGTVPDLPDLTLFHDVETMRRVAEQLDVGGYVEDAEFCMVRAMRDLVGPADERLVFERAIFIGGSVIPGDDVLIALDMRSNPIDPPLVVFDWSKPVPSRWSVVGSLGQFVVEIHKHGFVNGAVR